MSHLGFLGAAYAAVWLLIFVYAFRLSREARRLSDRVDRLEKAGARDPST